MSAPASSSIVTIVSPRPRLIAWCRQRWALTSTPRSRNQRSPAASSKSSVDVADERRPAREAVGAGDLALGVGEADPALALAGLGLLAQVLE
jgi:hypothetical protein